MTLLTLNDAGQLSASFVETETLQACEHKIARIKGVFKAAEITIVKSHCGVSEYRFSPFSHTQNSRKMPSSYRIIIDESGLEITAIKLAQCERELAEETVISNADQTVFCATSSQSFE